MKLKSLAIIVLCSLMTNMLLGQYTPMVEEGKYWIYLDHEDEDHPKAISGHAVTFQGDTIVNSVSYKKVYQLSLKGYHNCQYPPCFQFNIPYQSQGKLLVALIREDTLQKKVFNLPLENYGFCGTIEHLLFDFSLETGDTLNACLYDFIGANPEYVFPLGIVDSIKVVPLFGKERTTLFTTGVYQYGGLPWYGQVLILEGVGLEKYGVFHQPLSYLVDFCEGGMEACDLISSNSVIERKKEVNIFPNPTNGNLHISTDDVELKSIRIYSMLGVFKTEFRNTNEIDLSAFEGGVYLLELISENGERIVKKVIKEN